ncbi:hypothetical protein M8818_002243 [Zalaria obscura]|uniref:Uncharacterized protein n=1 Tax=Zalaria obscura TaxID=2024903 RepID=A0ACC3SI96_9PEZI
MVTTAGSNNRGQERTPCSSELYERCTTSELVGFLQGRKDELEDLRPYTLRILKRSDKRRRFRFLDLPLEIRTMIYGLLVKEDRVVERIRLPEILFTCHQIYTEAAGTYFSVNGFLFIIDDDLKDRRFRNHYHMHKPAAISAMCHLVFAVLGWYCGYRNASRSYGYTSFVISLDTAYHTPSRKPRLIGYRIHDKLALEDVERVGRYRRRDRSQPMLHYIRESASPVLDEIISPEGPGLLSLNAIKQICAPLCEQGTKLRYGPDRRYVSRNARGVTEQQLTMRLGDNQTLMNLGSSQYRLLTVHAYPQSVRLYGNGDRRGRRPSS